MNLGMSVKTRIIVSISEQTLTLEVAGEANWIYTCSTASNGPGQAFGSEQTPLGCHVIRAKIGEGLAAGSVLIGRRPSGEVWSVDLAAQFPHRDWILSRILWLSGLQRGFNRLGEVDTMRRFIYIHGTPDTEAMGVPLSHGCIRMRNADIIDLFDRVSAGVRVDIVDDASS